MKKSYWTDTLAPPRFAKLARNLQVDVVIVGGGITGITAAYLLKRSGRTVALVERDRCMQGDTAHTTAHLTCVVDRRLDDLVKYFGRDHARAVWDSGLAAIKLIEENVERERINCEFRRVPAYLHAPVALTDQKAAQRESHRFNKEAALAHDLGFDAAYVQSVPLFLRPGMRVADQAKFHPLKYLAALLSALPGKGSHVFEHSEVEEVSGKPLAVKANSHSIQCEYVVIATHVPLTGKNSLLSATLFQTKLAPYSSYAIGAKLPKGSLPEALFWDTSDPYFYFRADRRPRFDYAIFGGLDHKTGQVSDTQAIYDQLEAKLRSFLPTARINHRWSGQVIQTNDGLPLIGELSPRQFIATGFGGNGMTFGTLSAMMACDAAMGRPNPWQELFDVHRKKARGGTWDYVKENLDYPYYLVKDQLAASEGTSLRSLKSEQGKILTLKGHRVAASRDGAGKVTLLSPTCTHLGCTVQWNNAERTWDCPCHGSRFKCTGEVIAGPAEAPLKKL
jgi:glycine/D-amino acid oxidase-like deaminating enzyme/nitrite reductase/ring-hydroxylating ferredoxin subunit